MNAATYSAQLQGLDPGSGDPVRDASQNGLDPVPARARARLPESPTELAFR
jgi:hypothetical protein